MPPKDANSGRNKKNAPAENKFADIIGSFSTMGKDKDADAMSMLHKIASHVRPIMKKRGWTVGTLKEFFPANKSLQGLNVNRGQQIMLRLRQPSDEKTFFDFDWCLGTMLHELCHIVRGPHDAQFYKLLDELNKEMDELIAKGFRGDGFEAPGRRVGEGVSHDVPPHVARQKALEAAQKRMRFNGWIGTEQSGQKLGGSGDLKSLERVLNPGQLAAMAAEKRAAQDRIWCGSDEHAADGTVDTDNGALEPSRPSSSSSSRAPPAQSANDGVRTERNAQPEERKSKPPRSGKGSTPVINLDSDEEDGLSSATLAKRLPKKRPPDGRWACNVCTLESDETNLDCAACGTPRPGIPPATQPKAQLIGWYCPFCMAHNADDRFRMCGECGFLRQL